MYRAFQHTCFVFVLLCGCFHAAAQQPFTWYFGYGSGVTWVAPSPTGVLPYRTNNGGPMATPEGQSVACDASGYMIIYCNGGNIYNRNRQLMVNGNGIAGNPSSFQASVIVPKPGSSTLYYVFVSDAIETGNVNGYSYCIVDITGDNGNGAVVTRNVPMQAPGTERLAAVKHANGIDVWILTNDKASNVFRAWLLTCNGLSANPVVSAVGQVVTGTYRSDVGVLKASPDGEKVVQTHFDEGDGLPTQEYLQIFDFDNSTGILSNPKTIDFFNKRMHGAEFSPDSRLLYVTDGIRPEVMQLEAKLPTAAAVKASAVFIPAGSGFFGIQAGPDNKLYLARYGMALSTINKPDIKGPGCDFRADNIGVNGFCNIALPSFINTAFNDATSGYTVQIADSCTGRVQFTASSTLQGVVQWFWDFGDGQSSSQQNPVHVYAEPNKKYKVELRISSPLVCGGAKFEKFIIPQGVLVQPDFRFEARCDSGFVRMVNTSVLEPEGYGSFTWFFGDGTSSNAVTPQHTYTAAGQYNVKLRFNALPACIEDSITHPYNNVPVVLQVNGPLVVDEGSTVTLTATGNANSFRWQPPDFLSDTSSANPLCTPFDDLVYYVTARNSAGCEARDSVAVKVNPIRDIYVPDAFSPNNDGRNDLFKPVMSRRTQLVQFAVFNRWGQAVYQTRLVAGIGWNGQYRGAAAETGAYAWHLVALDKNGKRIVRKGTVVLLR